MLSVEVCESRRLLATFVVTTAADDGSDTEPTAGSLRAEILLSDASPAPSGRTNEITFDIAGASTIIPASQLPTITVPTVIDGLTQPNTPLVLARGFQDDPTSTMAGLVVDASDSTIEGMTIDQFPRAAISLGNDSNVQILDNHLGTDPTGETSLSSSGVSLGNDYAGVFLENSSHDLIQGNVISGNAGDGLFLEGAQTYANLIVGNKIGTDAAGTKALPNTALIDQPADTTGYGIFLDAAPANTVGGTTAADANIISSNASVGLCINGAGALENLVEGNRIGTDVTGTLPLGNDSGVAIFGGSSNTIGGTAAGAGNVISDNLDTGVYVNGPTNDVACNTVDGNLSIGIEANGDNPQTEAPIYRTMTIQGNLVGTNAQGASGLGNDNAGIQIQSFSDALLLNNVVSGSTQGSGIIVLDSNLTDIEGNLIGTDPTGAVDLGNGAYGIDLDDATNTRIYGSVIAGTATSIGVFADGTTVETSGTVLGNPAGLVMIQDHIGTNLAGTAAMPNGQGGVIIDGDGASDDALLIQADLISGNGIVGASITGVAGAIVESSLIGTNATATAALPNGSGTNGFGGLSIANSNGAHVLSDIISGNRGIGLELDGSGFVVGGNEIGVGNDLATSDGAIPLANTAGGARISGSGIIEGNTISSNGTAGVAGGYGLTVEGGSDLNSINPAAILVLDNKIGTDAEGLLGRGNQGVGIEIGDLTGVTLAGVTVEDNLISANTSSGIEADSSIGNQVEGNVIGTGATRTERLGNGGDGIDLVATGLASVTGNLVVDNSGNGVEVDGAPQEEVSNTYIADNLIGTRLLPSNGGYAAGLGNAGAGVLIDGSAVEVIGNVIDSSGTAGISGTSGFGLEIEYDYIGTAPSNAGNLGNGGDGIEDNGGGTYILGNAIGSNAGNGINLINTNQAYVHGNFIGTDAHGLASTLGNRGDGILIQGTGGLVAGTNYVDVNTIVNNGGNGVEIEGSSYENTLAANRIGGDLLDAGDAREVASGNAKDGVLIGATRPDQNVSGTMGLTGFSVALVLNIVALSDSDGVQLDGADDITTIDNSITLNGNNGFEFDDGATTDDVGGDVVTDNQGDGFLLDQSSSNVLSNFTSSDNQGEGLRFVQSPGNVINGATVAGNKGGNQT